MKTVQCLHYSIRKELGGTNNISVRNRHQSVNRCRREGEVFSLVVIPAEVNSIEGYNLGSCAAVSHGRGAGGG